MRHTPAPTSAPLVPLHPEAVPGDEQALRWVMPAGTLPFVGAVASVPAALQALLDDGTVDTLHVAPTSIIVRLGAGRRWRDHGGRVRTALHAALAEPSHWAPASGDSADDRLRAAATEVIDGDVGAYIRSHGGDIELLDADHQQVRVRLSGACTHCPASEVTLSDRFETALRARYPDLVGVTTTADPRGARHLLGLPGRRS